MKPQRSVVCLALSLVPFVALAAPVEMPPEPEWPVLEAFRFEDNAAAQAAWTSMKNTSPVELIEGGTRPVLRLPCNLSNVDGDRVSWDWRVSANLARCREIRFRFRCDNLTPVSHFTIYFHSGTGWYSRTFGSSAAQTWDAIRVNKAAMSTEDAPDGWGAVDIVRISAWRTKTEDTTCYLADFGAIGADAPIALLCNDAAGTASDEAHGVSEYSESMAGFLDESGISYGVLGDGDLTSQDLSGVKLLLLPYCPRIADDKVEVLRGFVESGGTLLSFYCLPAALWPVLGFEPGQFAKQERPGQFATIAATDRAISGQPAETKQASWNIQAAKPIEGRSFIAAEWRDDAGATTGYPALLVSDRGAYLTHVLLADDRETKRLLLLSMIGHFLPEQWRIATDHATRTAGRFGPYPSTEAACAGIRDAAGDNADALERLRAAENLLAQAQTRAQAAELAEALAAAGRAHSALVEAYCAMQRSEPNEHRAFWCHDAFGVSGMTWDEAIRRLADNGFTAILPNMLWGGTAYYASEVLPIAPSIAEKGDQIALCVAACRKHGVACHVWKVNWNTGGRASKEFVDRMKSEGRTQVLFDGTEEPKWLCPSNPANQDLEIAAMVEVARKYDVDGVHFDYIRYPHGDACFCAGCRERFETILGRKVTDWPADVRKDPNTKQPWLDFRRKQITRVVAAVAEQVRAVKPNVKISAAVFPNWPTDRDTIGQDWSLWCEKGYLDFVCPMDYTPSDAQFENHVANQLEWAHGIPCYPGIGLSVWTDPTDTVKLIVQIAIARKHKTGGFTVFNYGAPQASDVVPLCGLGVTRR